jgi:hypothetical protein
LTPGFGDGDTEELDFCGVSVLLVSVFVDTVGEELVVDAGAVSVAVALPVTSMDTLAAGTPGVTLGVVTTVAVWFTGLAGFTGLTGDVGLVGLLSDFTHVLDVVTQADHTGLP